MTRAFLLGLALLATACGTKKPTESLCTAQVPPPAACSTPCDPAPGAPSACPSGFHCSADGKCDTQCTATGGECGTGFVCTADGTCTSDGTGSGDPPIDAADCPKVHVTAKKITPVVELLLDQSGSMTAAYPGSKDRWNAMRDALVNTTDGIVKQLAPSVIFGSALYTAEDDLATECPVLNQKPRVIDNFAAIRQQLVGQDPKQNTPTGDSIKKIVADFAANPPADPTAPKIIVLATDGLPDTCLDRNPTKGAAQLAANKFTEEETQKAFTAGIKLFFLFVGDADTDTVTHAKRMANAGAGKDLANGAERFFEATSAAELTAAFNTIIGSVVSCDLTLSETVPQEDAPLGQIKLNGTNLVYMTDWTLDADGKTLHLVGSACTTFKSVSNSTVDGTFPCGPVIF